MKSNLRGLSPFWGLFGEIGVVAGEEGGDVGGEDVDFAVDLFLFARGEAADAEVAVETGGDALEEFLIGLPGGGEEGFAVGGEAADQAVAGDVGVEGAGVDVVAAHVAGHQTWPGV